MQEVRILRIDLSARKALRARDCVAEEKPMHLYLNGNFYATIFCTPSNLKELATGHLVSEGIVKAAGEIEDTELEEDVCRVKLKPSVDLEKRLARSELFQRVVRSACGIAGAYRPSDRLPEIESNLTVSADVIMSCVCNLNKVAEVFRKTGGVHVAGVYKSDGTRVAFAEDVGRHNAVDKIIGFGAMNKIDFKECFLAVSGRLTGDMVLKAARVGLPIVASLAAGLDSGIAIAEKTRLTLIGFVRGNRMNVYTFPRRIIV